MGNTAMCTPFANASMTIGEETKVDFQRDHDRKWLAIKSLIAAISVPAAGANASETATSFSEASTPVDNDHENEETSALLLPKIIDVAASTPPSPACAAYGTFNTNLIEEEKADAQTIVPLHPSSLLTSAALTPVYLILMLLPLLPFWIFAGFLTYVAATSPLKDLRTTLLALGILLPFNVIGTVAVVRFALHERRQALAETDAGHDLEAVSPLSERSDSGSGSVCSEKRRTLWRPSMRFVLHGARREGRRL